jgi:hypothetical protein
MDLTVSTEEMLATQHSLAKEYLALGGALIAVAFLLRLYDNTPGWYTGLFWGGVSSSVVAFLCACVAFFAGKKTTSLQLACREQALKEQQRVDGVIRLFECFHKAMFLLSALCLMVLLSDADPALRGGVIPFLLFVLSALGIDGYWSISIKRYRQQISTQM